MNNFQKKGYKREFVLDSVPNYFTVVLYEPHEFLSRMYRRHLENIQFRVIVCDELGNLLELIRKNRPHVLIAAIGSSLEGISLDELAIVNDNFPYLHVVTLSDNLEDADISSLMKLGVSSHVNRKFTRPRDIASVARHVVSIF